MGDILISFNASLEGSLEEEFKQFQMHLRDMLIKALPNLVDEMKDALKNRIETDVYSYKNKEYPRRSDNPQFGIPLINMDANVFKIGEINQDGSIARVGINYKPDGSHSGTTADLGISSPYYDADSPEPLKPNPVHGDDLIRRIETGKGYDWKTKVGKREFWQNFVNEMVDTGFLEEAFVRWLQMQDSTINVFADGSLTREEQDGQYGG